MNLADPEKFCHVTEKLIKSLLENVFSVTAQQITFVNFVVYSSTAILSVIKN
jgi:hypothetical protein